MFTLLPERSLPRLSPSPPPLLLSPPPLSLYITTRPVCSGHGVQRPPTGLLTTSISPAVYSNPPRTSLLSDLFPQVLRGGLVPKSCPTLASPRTVDRQAPLSMGFSRQEYWSASPFPFPEELPNQRIEPGSPALQADSLPIEL